MGTINWAAISGEWEYKDDLITSIRPTDENYPYAITLSSAKLRGGSVNVKVNLDQILKDDIAAKIIFGHQHSPHNYYAVGIGGYGSAYSLHEYINGKGWIGLVVKGQQKQLQKKKDINVMMKLQGQKITLEIDGVKVIDHYLPHPLFGDQLGLFTWGKERIEFKGLKLMMDKPKAFVVMQFSDEFNELYKEVIQPVTNARGLSAFRADDVYKPGMILEDIIKGILESEVVIAEITPINQNVFYELGYAHAMKKPTILLAEKGNELPFDIKGFRCIFYENSIGGKKAVEEQLRRHLENILE